MNYPTRSTRRESVFGVITFVTNNTDDPAAADTVDEGFLASAITLTDTGTFKITLRGRYKRVAAWASLEDSTEGLIGSVFATTEGLGAENSIEIKTEDGGSFANTTDKTIKVLYVLGR